MEAGRVVEEENIPLFKLTRTRRITRILRNITRRTRMAIKLTVRKAVKTIRESSASTHWIHQ
jgi:hypothetical protein